MVYLEMPYSVSDSCQYLVIRFSFGCSIIPRHSDHLPTCLSSSLHSLTSWWWPTYSPQWSTLATMEPGCLDLFYCEYYAFPGSLFGCISIWSMVWIPLDICNVIVKGVAAEPLTNKGAFHRILFTWTASHVWCLFLFIGWNRYVPEGIMTVSLCFMVWTQYLVIDFTGMIRSLQF